MRIVLAPNAFKECLSAPAVARAMARGVERAAPEAETVLIPLADGGDGTVEALVSTRGGNFVEITASDPLMRPVHARYGLIDNGKTAVIEMASASGLWRLQDHEKNPLKTTTYGVGEMIRHALQSGVTTLIVGIGGSATTDGGIGMAAALGYRLSDAAGRELPPVGESLSSIVGIDRARVCSELTNAQVLVACDVTNPLVGPQGAAPVYGPQKGATPEMVEALDRGLENLSARWQETFGLDLREWPGGGAAGGLGAGLAAFCGAKISSGFDLIADYARLDDALREADLVLTGEGKIDASTGFGKVPAGVAQRAQRFGVPVVALAGGIMGDMTNLHAAGILALFSILRRPMSLSEAIASASELLSQTTEEVIRLWLVKVGAGGRRSS